MQLLSALRGASCRALPCSQSACSLPRASVNLSMALWDFFFRIDTLYVALAFIVLGVALVVVLSLLSAESIPLVPLTSATHVIITGGSSGIGLSVAKKLAAKGVNVSILARDEKKLKAACKEMELAAPKGAKNQRLQWYSCDVSDFEALTKVVDTAVKANGGRLDSLVASAGVTQPENFLETDLKHFSRLMDTNYLGIVHCTRAVVPHLKRNGGGRIIYVSSVLGLMGFPGYSAYCASKFAVHGLAQSLQIELSRFNISFSLAIPGNVDTPMFEEENKIKPPEVKTIEGSKGLVTPDHVADGIIDSFSSWKYHIPCHGLFGDTWNVAVLSGGLATASFGETFWQTLLAGLLRPIALMELGSYRQTLKTFNYNSK